MVIYKTTNLVNGKFYIGKDKGNNNWYLGSGKLLLYAIKKYGKENFKKEILESCSDVDHMREREIYWIEFYNATNKDIAYNIQQGGDGGDNYCNMSPEQLLEVKQKISDGVKKSISEGRKKHTGFNSETAKKANKIAFEQRKNDNFEKFTKKQAETKLKNGTSPSSEKMRKQNSDYFKEFWKNNPEKKKEACKKASLKRKGRKVIDVFIEKHGEEIGREKYEVWRTNMINGKKGKPAWNKGLKMNKHETKK